MAQSRKNPVDARERILRTAVDLFYRRGIHAVGVDSIVQQSGVAKMTLYKHFKSKDALVTAFLERRDAQWREWFEGAVARLGGSARDRLVAVFDALEEWFKSPDFRGCAFINATAELPTANHGGREMIRDHLEKVKSFLERLAQESGLAAPGEVAEQILLLVEGAIVRAVTLGSSDSASTAKLMARTILDRASSQDGVMTE